MAYILANVDLRATTHFIKLQYMSYETWFLEFGNTYNLFSHHVVECNPASYVTFHICLFIFSSATPQQSHDNDRVAEGILPPGCRPCYGDGGGVISGIYHRMTATQSSEFELKIAVKLEQWTARCLVNGISAGSLFKVQGQGAQIAVSTVIIGPLRDH